MKKTILVTGCAGYIGGTFAYEALSLGYKIIGVDNFINSSPSTVKKIEEEFSSNFSFIEEDLAKSSKKLLARLKDCDIDSVVHFAGLKAVGESEQEPLRYWENNLNSTINLLRVLACEKIRKIVFSSSATVYGDSDLQPISERSPIMSMSTYGSTKIATEQLLKDCAREGSFDVISLRYFNPVGSHQEKKIFENPMDMPNNLMPRIIRVALNLDETLNILGNDYDTRDGTGERDYIHIDDLIRGHFKALDYLEGFCGYEVFNLGTGRSITVNEIISSFERVNNLKINYQYSHRRKGDVAICYADSSKALEFLGWRAEKSLDEMCKDAWEAIMENIDDPPSPAAGRSSGATDISAC